MALVNDARPATRRSTVDNPLGPRYLGFVLAMGLSSLGDAAWSIALGWTVASSASPATAGAVLAIAGVPRLVTLLAGGAIADHRGPSRVMVTADLLRSAVMLVAAGIVAATAPTVSVLLSAAVALSLLGAFFVPASSALRPALLPPEHLVRGNALYLIGLRGGQAAGGPIGAWLMGLGGVALVALANAASFLVSATAVARIRPARQPVTAPGESPKSLLNRIGDGFRYLAGSRELRILLVVVGLTELASAGPVNIGVVLLANGVGAGAGGAGLLLTGLTLGATASFVLTMVRPPRRRATPVVVCAIAVQAGCLAMLATVSSIAAAIAGYVVIGFVTGLTGVILVSLIQRRCSSEVRGRVMSIMALTTFASVPLGNLTIGVMIQFLGLSTAMVMQSLIALAAIGAYCSCSSLRRARLD
jgi:MFS family permease